ncbi:MAG: hypothetical protein P4L57_02860 [Rhizomicrobium sp.]|nr:hypothetical protein [Rhizomicrobium sp.]
MTPRVSRDDAGLLALCAAAFVLAAILVSPLILQNGDLYWHIAAGRWMIENRAVLRIDPFSFTFTGYPWHTQGWLAQLFLAFAFVAAGFGGVLALCALAAAAAAGTLVYCLSRYWRGLLLVGGILLALVSAVPAVSALPYLLALPFAVLFTAGVVAARAESRSPSFVLLLALLAWANLHTSFILGLALVVLLGIEAVIASPRLAVARNWLVFCGYALLTSLATPYGIEGLVHAIHSLRVPLLAPVHSLLPLLLALPALAVLLRRATLLRAGGVAVLFVLALYLPAVQLFFAIAVPLLVAEPLAQGRFQPRLALRPSLAFAALALAALSLRAVLPLALPDSPVTPAAAFAHVPSELIHSPVLNEASFGGFLIVNDVRPFIDSRPHYPISFRARAAGLGDAVVLAAVLSHYHIRWTLLAPSNPAVKALDGLGWKRLYSGPFAVLHVNEAP